MQIAKSLVFLFALLLVAASAQEGRMLRHEVVVDASLDEVWRAFTTKEGVESWMVPLAEVDFRIGGTLRTSYNHAEGIGGPGAITHQIISYEPKRMFSTRYTAPQNAAPHIKLSEATWTVISMEPFASDRTRVSVSHLGFGNGPEWDKAYQHFDKGNAWTLDQLKKRFARTQTANDDARVLELLRSLTGGEWISENTLPDGKVFRARTRLRETLEGKFVFAEGWLGNSSGMWPHAHMLYGRDPESGELRFWNFDEAGAVARGRVWLAGDNRIAHEWNMVAASGKKQSYYIEITADGPDTMRMTMHRDATSHVRGDRPVINVPYKRVAEVPERFTNIRQHSGGTK